MMNDKSVVIVGPTGCGKTAAAIELAQKVNGEIICADSRTVYRGMDIGTAKPSALEMKGVPHWGLDLVAPDECFSVADFQSYATAQIAAIKLRGHVPIIVGGTGLYIDSIILDYQLPLEQLELRAKLSQMSIAELQNYCHENNIKLPQNYKNPRHLTNYLLRNGAYSKSSGFQEDQYIVVGITTKVNSLEHRIRTRAEQMLTNGVVEEARLLGKKYGWQSEAMTGNIYPLIQNYLQGEITEAQLIDKFVVRDRQLAKRQMTWFRRNPNILWSEQTDVVELAARIMS